MAIKIGGKSSDDTKKIQLDETTSITIKSKFNPKIERKFNSAVFRMNKVATWMGIPHQIDKEPTDEDYEAFHKSVVEFVKEVIVEWEGVTETATVGGKKQERVAAITDSNVSEVFEDFSLAYVLLNKVGDRYTSAFQMLVNEKK